MTQQISISNIMKVLKDQDNHGLNQKSYSAVCEAISKVGVDKSDLIATANKVKAVLSTN
jgi:hypothetical protein